MKGTVRKITDVTYKLVYKDKYDLEGYGFLNQFVYFNETPEFSALWYLLRKGIYRVYVVLNDGTLQINDDSDKAIAVTSNRLSEEDYRTIVFGV